MNARFLVAKWTARRNGRLEAMRMVALAACDFSFRPSNNRGDSSGRGRRREPALELEDRRFKEIPGGACGQVNGRDHADQQKQIIRHRRMKPFQPGAKPRLAEQIKHRNVQKVERVADFSGVSKKW